MQDLPPPFVGVHTTYKGEPCALSLTLSIYLSIYLSLSLSLCLSFYPSVSVSVFFYPFLYFSGVSSSSQELSVSMSV